LLDLAIKPIERLGRAAGICNDDGMQQPSRARRRGGAQSRQKVLQAIGMQVVRFQEESAAFDDVAARILALHRSDLACMTMLLFGGAASVDQLAAALHVPRGAVTATVGRLQLAGYARRRAESGGARTELTEHARRWIERIWGPVREDGDRLLRSYSTRDLTVMSTFMIRAGAVQERQIRRLREWLAIPSSPARATHLRGGLSPAALRRVQLFVEANLERTIHLTDLAGRAELSLHHFARAFRTSAGVTPRAFVEERRIERAKQLINETRHSLAEVAVECGFGTQSRLTTRFKRRTGFTPAEHRRGRSRSIALA
jgi:AraC family transcriptional regulator